ncbi:hypothetical protein ABZ372_25345, partial [Streptomyces sp. NPDC005921]
GRERLRPLGRFSARDVVDGSAERGYSGASLHAVLNGLQSRWLLDQELDIVGPVTDFVRLLLEKNGEMEPWS